MSLPEKPADTLGRYAGILRRRWLLVVALVLTGALGGLLAAKVAPKSYEATAKVVLEQQKQVDALLGVSGYTPDPERETNTGVGLITLAPIAERVRDRLGLAESSAALAAKVSTSVDRSSSIVSIGARDATPESAALLANAFAREYRDYRASSARAIVDEAIASGRADLARLEPGRKRTDLQRELRRLEVAAAFQTGGVQVVRLASRADTTRRPRPAFSAFLGGFLGLVVAALAIVILARTDRRVGGSRDLEEATGRPVVAVVPRGRTAGREAVMTLAMSLPGGSSVLLASPGPGEGTTDVALGLAHALGTMGRRAIAIEADLREPRFAFQHGLEHAEGLAGILAGRSTLERELVAIEWSADDGDACAWVIPAGSAIGPPQALLTGAGMAALMAQARQRAEVVLLAGAPVSSVGDSLALTGVTDSVLLVARVDVTRVDDLQHAMRALERMDALPEGIVATSRPARRGPWNALRPLRRASPTAAQLGRSAHSEVTAG